MNLLIGYRQGLIDAFGRQGEPFLVWPGKVLLPKERNYPLFDASFPKTYRELLACLPDLLSQGPFRRLIAGTEAAMPIAAALQRLWKLPGPSPLQLLRCHDKVLMKRFLRDVPMTPFLGHRPGLEADQLFQALGRPVVCKERGESGGRSLHFCETAKELSPLIGPGKLYERFVPASELSIETFRSRGRSLFCNLTQYYEKQHINIVPALLLSDEEAAIRAFNEEVLDRLGIQDGMTHLEIYRSKEGPLFGEIALRPPGGYIMDLLALAYDFSPWDAYVALNQGRSFDFPEKPLRWAAAHIFHPGAGELRALYGWQRVCRDPSVIKAKLKVEPGDRIAQRAGSGQDVAYVLQIAKSPKAMLDALERVKTMIRFEMAL